MSKGVAAWLLDNIPDPLLVAYGELVGSDRPLSAAPLDEAGQDGGVDQESGYSSVKALFQDAAVGFELGNVFVAERPRELGV